MSNEGQEGPVPLSAHERRVREDARIALEKAVDRVVDLIGLVGPTVLHSLRPMVEEAVALVQEDRRLEDLKLFRAGRCIFCGDSLLADKSHCGYYQRDEVDIHRW